MARYIVRDLIDDLIDAAEVARALANDTTWRNALDDGYNWLVQQDAIEYIPAAHELHVPSATTPGLIYKANGSCQCEAFKRHNACWHRAAARLVRRTVELGERRRIADRAARRAESQRLVDELFA